METLTTWFKHGFVPHDLHAWYSHRSVSKSKSGTFSAYHSRSPTCPSKLGEPCDDLAQPGDSRLLLTSPIRDCRFDSSFLSLLLTPSRTVKAKHVCFIRGSSDLVVGRSHMVSCASLRDPIKLAFVAKISISCIGGFLLPKHPSASCEMSQTLMLSVQRP